MDRNLILAFLLSSIIMIGYYSIFPPLENPIDQGTSEQKVQKIVEKEKINKTENISSKTIVPGDATKSQLEASVINFEDPLKRVQFSSANASIHSYKLKNYLYAMPQKLSVKDWLLSFFTGEDPTPPEIDLNRKVEMVDSIKGLKAFSFFLSGKKPLNYRLESQRDSQVVYSSFDENVKITKRYVFDKSSFVSSLVIELFNNSNSPQTIFPTLFLGQGHEEIQVGKEDKPKIGFYLKDDEFETVDDEDEINEAATVKNSKWAGTMDRHFLSVVQPDIGFDTQFSPQKEFYFDKEVIVPSVSFQHPQMQLKPGEIKVFEFKVFMGPKRTEELEKFDIKLTSALDFGFLESLSNILLAILRWLHSFMGNWGLAIIFLTIIVRIVLFPLALKGMLSMGKMGKLTPKMQQLKEKYKNDKERLNREIMGLYKKHKVNPVGGCLPMVMQIPIFFALYSALLPAIELRHQPFYGWIEDLSAPDHTLILPLLMGVSMFIQQRLTPMAATMDPAQEKMMKWFPIIMTFFFLDFPSGLVLYWVVSNVLSIFQQLLFNKLKEKQNIN